MFYTNFPKCLLKSISLLLIVFLFGCTSEKSNFYSLNLNALPLDGLSSKTKNDFLNSITYDLDGNVIGFEYKSIKSELGEEAYFDLIYVLLEKPEQPITYFNAKGNAFTVDKGDKTIFQKDDNPGLEPGTPIIFEDKKNYRLPGCKPKARYVCVIR